MKAYLLLFATIVISWSGCMWGVPKKAIHAVTTDTLAYHYQTVKQRAADCGTRADTACAGAYIKYPAFNNQQALNDTVKNRLISIFKVDKKKPSSLQQLALDFLDQYKQETALQHKNIFFRLNIQAKIVRQDSSLTTLQIDGYTFQGGAHAASSTTFINWNTKTSKSITLDDLFTDGYKEKFNAIAERIFRKQEELSDTASLKTNYFFKGGKFALNNNFSITPLGIRFLYNEYEIKPYAAGKTDLLLPYSQISSLLKPNTVASQYLK